MGLEVFLYTEILQCISIIEQFYVIVKYIDKIDFGNLQICNNECNMLLIIWLTHSSENEYWNLKNWFALNTFHFTSLESGICKTAKLMFLDIDSIRHYNAHFSYHDMYLN